MQLTVLWSLEELWMIYSEQNDNCGRFERYCWEYIFMLCCFH